MYLIIFLWNPLFGFFCVIKKIFAFSVGGLFSLSTHALTCLRRRRFRRSRKLIETVLPSNTIMPISFEASRRGTQRLIITIASEAPGLTKCWSPDWLEEQEEKGENIDRPNTKWAFEDHLVVSKILGLLCMLAREVCPIGFETKRVCWRWIRTPTISVFLDVLLFIDGPSIQYETNS